MASVRKGRAAVRLMVLGALCAALAMSPSAGAMALVRVPGAQAAFAGTQGAQVSRTQVRSGRTYSRAERGPTAEQLRRQQAKLARLRATEKRQAAGILGTRAALQRTAITAGRALEDYSATVHALQARQLIEQQTQDALESAQRDVDAGQQQVGSWARQAYQGGNPLAADPTLNVLLQGGDTADMSTDLAVLNRIGQHRGHALATFQQDQSRASAAADTAVDASQAAATAAIKATSAHRAADHAVALQRQMLADAQTSLAATRKQAKATVKRQAELRRAAQAAAAAEPAQPGGGTRGANKLTGPVGSCAGGAVQQYGNGQIPLSALCPLWSAPRQYLRADAAYAFDRLSQAYDVAFGQPICVTDSYRSYQAQVSLYARKPNLAAVPGTSNHGWGTAVDLCGGIESFGTATHQWMLLSAPLYGWFHPSWAQPSGSRPEPWHWEFGG